MSRAPVTALVICYNEEAGIERCLQSLTWADDLFVIDSFSTDGTMDIVRRYTSHVVQHAFTSPAAQKNWALPQCRHDTVLAVDADEWVSDELRVAIERVLANKPLAAAYTLKRENDFFGTPIKHCGWDRDYVLRLFDRKQARYADVRVHEKVLTEAPVEHLPGVLYHTPYKSMPHYFEKLDRYTTWGAEDLFTQGRRAGIGSLLLRPPARFLKMYFLQLGFLDGVVGLILCMLAATNVLMKYVKLWGLQQGHTTPTRERKTPEASVVGSSRPT